MNTAELQEQVKAYVEQLSPDAYLADRERQEAIQELLVFPYSYKS